MNCKEVRRRIIFLVDGELPKAEEKEAMDHISHCKLCASLYSSFVNVFIHLESEKKINSNAFLITRVLQKVKNENSTNKKGKWEILKESVVIIVVAAAITIGVVLGYVSKEYYIQPERSQISIADDYTNQVLSAEAY